MRMWTLLVAALLLTACSSSSAPRGPVGPQQLEVAARPDGWVLKATAASNTGRDRLNRPGSVWWLGPDNAFVVWQWGSESEVYQINLSDGTVEPEYEFTSVLTDSPDGRHAVLRKSGMEDWIVDMTKGEKVYRLPENTIYTTWLTPTLLHVVHHSYDALLYDLRTGRETPLPGGGHRTVLLAEAEVCSPDRSARELWCVPVAGGEPVRLTPESLPSNSDLTVAWNAGRRYLAVTYSTGPATGWRFSGTSLAAALAKPVQFSEAKAVAVYDGVTHERTEYALGGRYTVHEMVWSPDGTYLAISMSPMSRPERVSEFRMLHRVTGVQEIVTSPGGSARLRMVTDQGEVIFQKDDKAEPQIVRPGEKARAWAPGLRMLPGPGWSEPPGPLAFVGEGRLEVRTQDGATYDWPWEGKETDARLSLGPGDRWGALQFFKPGEAVFLKR